MRLPPPRRPRGHDCGPGGIRRAGGHRRGAGDMCTAGWRPSWEARVSCTRSSWAMVTCRPATSSCSQWRSSSSWPSRSDTAARRSGGDEVRHCQMGAPSNTPDGGTDTTDGRHGQTHQTGDTVRHTRRTHGQTQQTEDTVRYTRRSTQSDTQDGVHNRHIRRGHLLTNFRLINDWFGVGLPSPGWQVILATLSVFKE